MKKSSESDHSLPLFKGKSVNQLLATINNSHIKPYTPYTDEEKEETEMKIRELLKETNHPSNHR